MSRGSRGVGIGVQSETDPNAVLKSLYDAGTFLYATSDNTPQPKTVAETGALLAPAFTDWNPVIEALGGGLDLGTDPTQEGEYLQIGKLVIAAGFVAFGTGSPDPGSGPMLLTLPVAPKTVTANTRIIGHGYVVDMSDDIAQTTVQVALNSALHATKALFALDGQAGAAGTGIVDDDTPFAWATTDRVTFRLTYEAA